MDDYHPSMPWASLVPKGGVEMRFRLPARRKQALFTTGPYFLIFLFSPSYILFKTFFYTKSESTTLI
jgi:hypothetical protein